MSILNSDIIQNIIKELATVIRKNTFESNELPKFVFICGEQIINKSGVVKNSEILEIEKNKRQLLINKFLNNRRNNIVCVISEKIYNNDLIIDTLTFEELLAELSHEIIILVESYGTVCELGAFTVKDRYLNKLLVINDKKYKNEKSFINEGPIRKLLRNNEERYILTDYEYGKFNFNFQVNEYIKSVKESNTYITPNKNEDEVELRGLIYELLNIVEIFQPISQYELFYIYKKVKGFKKYNIKNRDKHGINSPSQIIGLMNNMDLIKINNDNITKNGNYTYYNALFNITRKMYNKFRIMILYEIMSKYSYRIESDQNEYITINE